MPAFLDRGDRHLVIGAVVVMLMLLGATYVLQPAPDQQDLGTPSSFSSEWLGTKAAYLLLQQSGYRVERWAAPPNELPENGAGITLIYAEPSEPGTVADRAAVSHFVSSGGRLVVMGASGASFAPESTAVAVPSADLTPQSYEARIPSPITRGANEVTFIAPDAWKSLGTGQVALYARKNSPGVVWYRFGKGEVIWWAISSPISNGSLRDKDNLALFLNSVGPRDSRVLWDEYTHGMRRSLGSYFARTPLPWAGLQIACAFAAVLFTFSRRSGPVHQPLGESRLSPLEFVETLGDLYDSAHAAPGAVEVAYQHLRLALIRRLGLPANAPVAALSASAARQLGWPEQELLHTLNDAERASRYTQLDGRDALALVQTLHDFSDRLQIRQQLSASSTL